MLGQTLQTTRSIRSVSTLSRGKLTSSHSPITLFLQFIHLPLQKTSRTHTQTFLGVWIKKANKEKGYIVLPWDAAEGGQVGHGDQIAVSVFLVGDAEFTEVGLVVHVPAEDDAAEAEACLGDGEEFGLGHEFAAEHAIDVETGDFHGRVVFEDRREVIGSDGGGVERRHGGG
jgi:hypothetical protein